MGAFELCLKGGTVIAAVASLRLAGDMAENPLGVDFEETIARFHLDDPEIARSVKGRSERFLQLGFGGRDIDRIAIATGDKDDFIGASDVCKEAKRSEAREMRNEGLRHER
jgi:hypothetical protein